MKSNSSRPSGSVGEGGEALRGDDSDSIGELLPSLVERHAIEMSDAEAVRTARGRITYAELNAQANRVAWTVLDRIGQAEEPVAVAFNDDIDFIASLLGVVKSGNAVLPVGSEDPPERTWVMLQKAGVRLVLADDARGRELESARPGGTDIVTIDPRTGPSLGNPGLEIDPASPAYIIFTSGSTGRPKGVARTHRHLRYRFDIPALEMGPGSRVSLIPALAFTSAMGLVFRSLGNGATACRFDPRAQGIHRLAEWINDEEITLLWAGPATLRAALDGSSPRLRFPTVKAIYASGAPLLRGDVDIYKRHFPDDCVLVNGLGTTETGVIASYVIDKGAVVDGEVVPVGYPLDGVRIILLDDDGQEVPPGEPGTMYVESFRLADGYWRDPELTKQAFVPHPLGGQGVVYRSGDLAVKRPDGCLIFLGRRDDRVKVRGYSVDLLEVERALGALAEVRQAAVIAREFNGETRLIAYAVPRHKDRPPSSGSLREQLGKALPAYAIPTNLVTLDALPLTTRGKIDRRALPVADVIERPDRPPRPPADDLERALLAIWREVLGREDVGTDDHFFDELAGSSMQGLRVFAQIARRMDRDLAPTTLLRAPTIESLARVIRDGGGRSRQASLVPMRTEGAMTPLFFVHGGNGGAFFVADMAKHLHPDRPVYGLQVPGFDGVPTGYRPVEELATRYLAEVQTVQPHGPYLLGGLSFGGLIALEMAQLLDRQGETTQLLVLLDTHRPTDADIPSRSQGSHRQRIRRLNPLGKIRYLLAGIRRRLNDYRRTALIELRLRTGRPLEGSLRDFHFWRMCQRAEWAYRPEGYAGPVLFIASRARAERRRMEWDGFLHDVIDLIEVDAEHDDLVVMPWIREVCQHLETGFEHAAAASRS